MACMTASTCVSEKLYLQLSADEAKILLCKIDPQNGEKTECDQMLISDTKLPKECWISFSMRIKSLIINMKFQQRLSWIYPKYPYVRKKGMMCC